MRTQLFIFLQHLTPQKLLSRTVGYLAECKISLIKNFLIRHFIDIYKVNMDESEIENVENFESFNAFFCRELKQEVRQWNFEAAAISSPVDGKVSQIGKINSNQIFQAKNKSFSLEALLGGNTSIANELVNGSFATIYLSPKDYHRIHMPTDGSLQKMLHIPGKLFSVNPTTTENVNALFAKNERVVCLYSTNIGPMVMVYVGAMIVASIETPWAGLVAPAGKHVQEFDYMPKEAIQLKKGDECGRFKLGSTVILLFPENTVQWKDSLTENTPVSLGNTIGTTL